MDRSGRFVLGLLLAASALIAADAPAATDLRFEVSLKDGLVKQPVTGRVVVILGKGGPAEPRRGLASSGPGSAPRLGADANDLVPGRAVTLDANAALFPLPHLAKLPAGKYHAQAVLLRNRDLNVPSAPGTLYSEPLAVELDPAKGGTVKLELTKQIPDEEPPPDAEQVKFLKVRSEALSKFHGRDIFLRCAVILPRDFAKEKDRRYPLRVHIGGFGTRYTTAQGMMRPGSGFAKLWNADDTPRMLMLCLDGAGPLGDPYQVDSANHGPYGAALTRELIPHVEKAYRGVGAGHARFTDGHSTGGWVSLALQVFYPDFFNGCWSSAPDPVDFRAFELIDVYRHTNAFVNAHGFERPAMRELDGDTVYTMRHEVQLERVLGRGGNWALSGRDWASWNATFSPRGADGLPVPLWDASGKIDREVAEHWKKYDLRLKLQTEWADLGPKLRGKLHVCAGEADDYFLNNAVHHLDDFLKKAEPPADAQVTFGARRGHGYVAWSEKEMLKAMGEAAAKGRTP